MRSLLAMPLKRRIRKRMGRDYLSLSSWVLSTRVADHNQLLLLLLKPGHSM